MSQLKLEQVVNAPPRECFVAFSDLRNAASNIRGIKSLEVLTDGPIGKGTRFKETRVMFGRESTETMSITQWEPHAATPCYAVGGESCGARFEFTFRFHPHQGGTATRVEIDMTMQAVSLFAKIMAPLSKLMMGPMKKCLLADIADMQRVAEARA